MASKMESPPGRRLPTVVALVLMALALTTALWSWYQAPAALQALPAWAQWLLQPYERNAFAQLDFVGGDIHAAFVRDEQVWLVGSDGLLLHSRDGGARWQSDARIDWRAAADVVMPPSRKATLLPLFAPAFAAAPLQQQSPRAAADAADGNVAPQKQSAVDREPRSKQAPLPPQTKQAPLPPVQNLQQATPAAPAADGPVDLHAITFFDAQRGVAVGAAGVILLTQDGGASWSARHSATVSSLQAVAYLDAATLIAAGSDGVIVISRDGGNGWARVDSGVVVDLHGISLLDDGGVIIVGAGGCILRSADGAGWQAQWRAPRQTLRAVAALAQRVVAVGDAGTLLQSADGGRSWHDATLGAQRVDAVLALGQGHWLVAGVDADGVATLWRSTDDGRRWQPQPLRGHAPSLRALSLLGGSGATASVLVAGDGGTVLQLQDKVKPLVRGVDQALVSSSVLRDEFIAGGGNLLLRSTDGAHWRAIEAPIDGINAVQRIGKRVALVAGERGAMARSVDGGVSWQRLDSGTGATLYSVAANGDGVVIAAGALGTVLRSTDGGKSWIAIDSGAPTIDILALAFSGPTTVLLATNEGVVLRSIDAGVSWQGIGAAPMGVIRAFAFADARNGIAVGEAGLILRTANGGKSWQPVAHAFTATLRTALYLDGNRVLAGGDDGALIESRDGGSTWRAFAPWQAIAAPVSALGYGDVSPFTDTARLVVVTQDGAVFSGAPDADALQAATYQRYPSPLALALLLGALLTLVPAAQRRNDGNGPHESVADLLVSDRPLAAGDADYMDFSRRAAQLSRFLRHEKTELPVTLAISAEWGRGKSSLMNLMAEDLAANGFRPVWFNAWHHQKEGHLLGSLLRAVQRQALPHVLTPAGFLMRVQLLSHRGASYLIAAAFPVVVLLALAGYFSAYPERLAAVGPNVRYLLNIENPVTITAQSMAQLEQAARGEHEKMLKYWLPVLDSFRATRHVFVDTDEMILAMRQRQHPSAAVISSELVAQVTKAAEHLRPPIRVFPELGNVWTGLSAVFAALIGAVTMVLNGMSVFGLRHARMASSDSGEKAGTRERIATDFSRLTDVLGKRLVIMIDDLDRCSRANLLDMLEHINFLASEGRCAIVVAMAYDRVVRHLAVSLAEDAGRRVDDGPSESDLAEAHFYLHKLIQLMVTIRPPRRDETREMLTGRHGVRIRRRKPWKRTLAGVWRHTQPWLIILALAYAGVLAGSRGLQLLSPTPTLKLLEQRINALQQEPATTTSANAMPVAETALSTPAPVRTASGFRPAQPAAFPWWLLGTVVALLLAALLGLLLYRDPHMRRQLANRMRLALAVPVREQDSSQFVRALQLWHGVIADHLQSPRALKRFLNRLRFLAMGVMSAQQHNDAVEAHVVALAALAIDNVDIEYGKLSPAQKALLDQHVAIFGRAPNDAERELYLDLVGEVDRLAMVGMG